MTTAPPGQVKRLSTELRQRADRQVRAQVSGLGSHLSAVVRSSPGRPLSEVLSSPDVQDRLTGAVDRSQARVEAAVREAWRRANGPGWSPYLDALLSDLQRTYSQASADVLTHASRAYRSVAARPARRPAGVYTVPGSVATANVRSLEVKRALDRLSAQLAVRAGMTVSSAVARAAAEAELEASQGDSGAQKTWVADFSGNRPCAACASLHGQTVPVGGEFQLPPGVRLSVWQDLQAPPAHPYCHCRLQVTPGGSAPPQLRESPYNVPAVGPVAFEEVRSMPADQYTALVSLLRRASARLGEVLARLRSALGG